MSQVILVVEDEGVLAKNIAIYLERTGFEVRLAATAEQGLAMIEEIRPDAIVLDFNLPGMDGLAALARIRELDAAIPVLMMTGYGNVELAVEAMKAGAYDFLTKPVALSKLRLVLEKAFSQTRRDRALDYYKRRDAQTAVVDELIGDSVPMHALKQRIAQLRQAELQMSDAAAPAVLVLGETGSGKEVVARALHLGGPRHDKPFVELNCAAIPAQLLESELFGHERGAFTDARDRKIGLVETAEGGTLFLDEIGDMDIALQSKLLKLLDEKVIRRLGSLREQHVDVRIVTATHRPLEELVREGRFRADLYYRLCVVQLHLPALRERGSDILTLARHFLQAHATHYGRPVPTLTSDAEMALISYPWPGNVRELRNVLEQAVLLGVGEVIDTQHLALPGARSLNWTAAPIAPGLGASPLPATLSSLTELERAALVQALDRTGWNVSRAARMLGITRDTLRYRIEKHGLTAPLQ
ncbi:sigma-54 dependent transcriptional regulator [Polaromonas sp. P2-4]|nr:sigma-54 dependent transcriptional regulator [Polaromonas sp. P2-4]